MSKLCFKKERDRDFFMVCERVLKEEGNNMSVADIVGKALLKPAKSFYLHKKEYVAIIRKGSISLPKSEAKQKLHTEIIKRYNRLKKRNPHMNVTEITKKISEQKAPRFYLSVPRAMDLYYELLRTPDLFAE